MPGGSLGNRFYREKPVKAEQNLIFFLDGFIPIQAHLTACYYFLNGLVFGGTHSAVVLWSKIKLIRASTLPTLAGLLARASGPRKAVVSAINSTQMLPFADDVSLCFALAICFAVF